MSDEATPTRRFPWWLPLGALLIPCLYLPTLAMRFDFADDGILVYPKANSNLSSQFEQIGRDTFNDFRTVGPFRPVTWAHWDLSADWLGPYDFNWRAARFAWSILAAGSLLWLLYELKLRPQAAILATMLALWNHYRGEIWLGLGLTEAFGMPYALLALTCALRAARSARPLGWDIAGLLLLLAALGTKNTFAAIIPALLLLRLQGGGLTLREGWGKHGWRASYYALLLLLPITHFVALKLRPSSGHYATALTFAQIPRFLRSVSSALSPEYMAPGLLAAGFAVWLARRRGVLIADTDYRLPLLTGALLLAFGIAIYLPIDGVAGRYTMPAIWGADIWVAVLLSALQTVPLPSWRRLAQGLIVVGLVIVALINVGRQEKTAARNAVLWQALEYMEKEATPHDAVAWLGLSEVASNSTELSFAEAFHFQAHLRQRGRTDIDLRKISRLEERTVNDWPRLILTGTAAAPEANGCRLVQEFQTSYWAGQRGYHCYLWAPDASTAEQLTSHTGRTTP